MDPAMPPDLGTAIATEPVWLQSWVFLLGLVHAAALPFLVHHTGGRWRVRPEPVAVLIGFAVAGVLMGYLYSVVGYVRLLGLAHLIGWTPAFLWVWSRREALGTTSWFGKWAHAYLVIAGISLVVDAVDVLRYLVGDGELLNRWG